MPATLTSSVQLIADPGNASEYKLLELPPEIAALIEQNDDVNKKEAGKEASSAAGVAIKLGSSSGKRKRGGEDGDGEEFEYDERKRILTINGRYMDDAVVCTSSRTYSLRQVSQSNSLLLCSLHAKGDTNLSSQSAREPSPGSSDSGVTVPPSRRQGSVAVGEEDSNKAVLTLKCSVKNTLELQWTPPKMERIPSLLRASMYEGEEEERRREARAEDDPSRRLYTMKEVRSVVQASPTELRHGLDKYRVLKLRGKARMIAPTYMAMLVKALLTHVDLHAYAIDAVPEREMVDALVEEHDVPRDLANIALRRWFGRRVSAEADGERQEALVEEIEDDEAGSDNEDADKGSGRPDESEDTIFESTGKGKGREHDIKLDMPAIVQVIGVELLNAKAKDDPVRLDSFISAWRDELGGVAADFADVDLLKGECLLFPAPPARATLAMPPRIKYFPSATLPLDASARFQELFLTRPQWILEDLLPFIENLAVDKNRRDALLLKFCRTSKVDVLPATAVDADSGRPRARSKTPGPGQKMESITLYSSRLRH